MKPVPALIAALLLTFSLGSVHAFSVLVEPMEARFGANRADVSLIYSIALISLTVAVLFGHKIYHRMTPPLMAAGACLLAASGLVVAGTAPSITLAYISYGVMFGLANGVGYGFALIASALAFPARQGMAMGVVTACYAVGAVVFAQALQLVHEPYGLTTALVAKAAVIACCGLIAAILFRRSGLKVHRESRQSSGLNKRDLRSIVLLWMGFGFGCTAGLMATGHAAGVVTTSGGTDDLAVGGVMVISLGNAVGGFLIAWLSGRLPLRFFLVGLPILSAICLVVLAVVHTPVIVVVLLAAIGLAYGAMIAFYPFATSSLFGIERTPRMYGLVFTAWGVAGFAGPWLAGAIFDSEGGYHTALFLAAGGAVISAAAVACLSIKELKTPGRA